MSESLATKAIRALVTATGSNGRRYVPGSLELNGRHMDWTERCSKTKCPHEHDECHAARISLFPSLDESAP